MGKPHQERSASAQEQEPEPSNLTLNRLRKELSRLWIDPPAFCRPGASPVRDDLFHFEAVIDGPDGSPYAGGTFPIAVDVPHRYPMRPPKVTFLTKVYHPNIDGEGQMVLDVFQDQWTPAYSMYHLLLAIVSILNDPLLDRAINTEIAEQYKDARDLYEATARDWTRIHASTPIVSCYPDERDWAKRRPDRPLNLLARMTAHYERLRRRRRRRRASAASPERPPGFRDIPSVLGMLIDPAKRRITKQFGFARPMWRNATAFLQDFSNWLASIRSVEQLWSGIAREN